VNTIFPVMPPAVHTKKKVRKSSLNNTSAVGTPALQNKTVQVRKTPRILKRVVIPERFDSKEK
jgi:hypothetical protein